MIIWWERNHYDITMKSGNIMYTTWRNVLTFATHKISNMIYSLFNQLFALIWYKWRHYEIALLYYKLAGNLSALTDLTLFFKYKPYHPVYRPLCGCHKQPSYQKKEMYPTKPFTDCWFEKPAAKWTFLGRNSPSALASWIFSRGITCIDFVFSCVGWIRSDLPHCQHILTWCGTVWWARQNFYWR